MKKYLVPLLLVALLVSCNHKSSSGKQVSSDISSTLASSEISSSAEETSNTTSESSSSASSSKSFTLNSSIQEPLGIRKKTVTFRDGGFTNSSLEKEESQKQFVDWFNGLDDVLTSINYEGYAQLNYVGDKKDSNRFTTLILGSQNDAGKIKFNLKYDIIQLKVVVQPYTKYVAFTNTYNIDMKACFIIDKKEYDLSMKDGYEGDTKSVEIEYNDFAEGAKSFSIANKEANQRVFVHSLEITYYAQMI